MLGYIFFFFFFFNDTATTEIYTLSLHDALPISLTPALLITLLQRAKSSRITAPNCSGDRKSTRLNSSHGYISYAVFCLKKKKTEINTVPCIRHRSTQGVNPHHTAITPSI